MGQYIGVVGAGVMGRGVAQSLLMAGHRVLLLDISDTILSDAKREIGMSLRMEKMFNTTGILKSIDDLFERLTLTTDISSFHEVDYVIENATEKWEVKKQIYLELDKYCNNACMFAVNTSCISITKIAALTKRPEQIVGIHFMNPVPRKPVVEMIKGFHTSNKTLEESNRLLATMGKTSLIVEDFPGFVTNRILMLTINEAVFVLQDQVAAAWEVDAIFKQCFGHKMGPLETADLIGLDTILYSIQVLYESFNDSKYRPCPLLIKMVDAGLLGMKSGQGFYDYYNKQ